MFHYTQLVITFEFNWACYLQWQKNATIPSIRTVCWLPGLFSSCWTFNINSCIKWHYYVQFDIISWILSRDFGFSSLLHLLGSYWINISSLSWGVYKQILWSITSKSFLKYKDKLVLFYFSSYLYVFLC